jgi:hypothetical protein
MVSVFDDVEKNSDKDNDGIKLRREWAMPNSWTFEIAPIRELVEREVQNNDGLWVDPFAGKSDIADVTNDLHPKRDTDYTMKAHEFLEIFDDGEVDGGIIVDPPYSAEQLKRQYDNAGESPTQDETNASFMSRIRDEIERVSSKGATVLYFGWDSTGIGKSRGFEKREILLVSHGSSRNDTICTVEDYCP